MAMDELTRLQRVLVEVVATFEGRFVYRVRCSYHGTVEATMDYARAEAAKAEHRIEHDLTGEEADG
jgi:hypothetical protein